MLRPDRCTVAISIWLALLDVVLSLAAPWPLKVVVDYALGHRPFPGWLAWLDGLHPVSVALIAAAAGLLLLAASAVASYLVIVLTTAVGERMTVRLRATVVSRLLERSGPRGRCLSARRPDQPGRRRRRPGFGYRHRDD